MSDERKAVRAFGKLKVACKPCEERRERKRQEWIARERAAQMAEDTAHGMGHHKCELCGKSKGPADALCARCRRNEVT